MALPSSKASSGNPLASANPVTARPLNPSPRSSETTNPMRRSFSGNPFAKPSIVANPRGFNPATPANSPSEFPRRRDSVPCPLREHEEKENGNDTISNARARVRSPSISKGSKHFMSPTISAASKFNPSPRKKILSERNSDQIHSSITLISDLRSSCGSVNISGNTEEPDAKMNVEASQDSTVIDSEAGPDASSRGSKGSRKKVAFDSVIHEIPPVESTHVGTEDDFVNVDEEFVNPKLPSSPLVAPLDADPFAPLPPYDPKTNYLSPRPQFLHYRPNPRIKGFIGDEGNFTYDPLDGFDLEGLTDTDVSTEETSQSERESDEASSNESTKQEAAPEPKPDGLKVSEEESAEAKEPVEKEKAVEAKELPKRSFFMRSMFVASILIALVAGSAMIGTQHSPMGSHLKIKGPSFPVQAQQLRDNIAEYTRIWYANSVSYLSELVSEFRGREYERGELQFYNLTDLGENPWLVKNDILGSPIQPDGFESLEVGTEEEEEIEYSETEEEVVAEKADNEGAEVPGDEPEEEDEIVDNESGQEVEIVDAETGVVEIDTEVHVEMLFAAEKHEAPLAAEPEYDQPELPPLEAAEESETLNVEATDQAELAEFEGEDVVYSPKEEEGSIKLEADHKTASESSESAESSQITAPVGVLATLLAAVACFMYAKKRTTPGNVVPPVKGIQAQEPLVAKKFDISPVAAIRATEFDVVGVESCPSEMSSFQNYPTSSQSKGTKAGLGKNDEARSGERKTIRRESTASSSYSDLSMGSSASYGSFTTYEMIPSKLRNGDEELVVTPIRRSSRLRK